MNKPYYKFSQYLNKKYGCKVYKLPINVKCTCPNRDGLVGLNGCIFCGEEGADFEMLSNKISVKEQLENNMSYIKQKYKADKFIAYFQNYSNTYMPLDYFKQIINEALIDGIVAIYISTRPDCINNEYLEYLNCIKNNNNIQIVIELGLQTVNYHTLELLNRGHGLAEFLDAVLRIKKFGFEICAHYIIDLPWDNIKDVIEGAKILGALNIEQVKCHSLYVVKNTKLHEMYLNKEFQPVTKDEYIERMITFLEYLPNTIVVQRLLGRAPKEKSVFCTWNTSWRKIQNEIEKMMIENNRYQGLKFDYINGKPIIHNFLNK